MSFWGKTGFNFPNPIDYGARPGVDATAAIQAAIDDAISSGAGGVFLPGIEWEISRTGATDYCLLIDGAVDFRFVGTGWASVLKLADGNLGGSGLSMAKLTGSCQRVVFEDVTFDGNRANVINLGAFYGLNIEDALDSVFQSLNFMEIPANPASTNGALRVGKGTGGDTVSQIIMSDFTFMNGDGVAFLAGDVESILNVSSGIITGFTDAIVVATTPAGTSPRDYSFTNFLVDVTDHAFLATGATGNVAHRVRMSGMVVKEGRVVIEDVDDVIISDSIFEGKVSGECVVIRDTVGDISFTNCTLLRSDSILIEATGVSVPEGVSIRGCFVLMDGAGFVFRVEGGGEITVDACYIVTAETVATQLLDVPLAADIDVLTLRSNTLLGDSTVSPVTVTPGSNMVGEIIVISNLLQGDATKPAIDLVAPTGGGKYTSLPFMADNVIVASDLIALTAFANFVEPAYVAGGNVRATGEGPTYTTRNAAQYCATVYMVNGDPTSGTLLTGYKGDQALRVDAGAGVGSTWHVKETDGGQGGWVAK